MSNEFYRWRQGARPLRTQGLSSGLQQRNDGMGLQLGLYTQRQRRGQEEENKPHLLLKLRKSGGRRICRIADRQNSSNYNLLLFLDTDCEAGKSCNTLVNASPQLGFGHKEGFWPFVRQNKTSTWTQGTCERHLKFLFYYVLFYYYYPRIKQHSGRSA